MIALRAVLGERCALGLRDTQLNHQPAHFSVCTSSNLGPLQPQAAAVGPDNLEGMKSHERSADRRSHRGLHSSFPGAAGLGSRIGSGLRMRERVGMAVLCKKGPAACRQCAVRQWETRILITSIELALAAESSGGPHCARALGAPYSAEWPQPEGRAAALSRLGHPREPGNRMQDRPPH